MAACRRAGREAGTGPTAALPRLLAELGADASTAVVAGGTERVFASADLNLPRLAGDQLRNALAFELRKHSPLPENQIAWGYRRLPGEAAGGGQRVRLLYGRETDWQRWIASCGGLTGAVDLILPPAAALDPVLKGRPVWFAGGGDEAGYLLTDSDGQGREWLAGATGGEGTFGALPEPLAAPGLDLGELGRLPPVEQQGFAPALLLAMYGLGDSLPADQHTWLPTPIELRPRRHRMGRHLAVFLAAYVLIVGAVLLTRASLAAAAHLNRLAAESRRIEPRIAELEKDADPGAFVEALGTEIGGIDRTRPTMAAALVELTERLRPEYWVSNFTWNEAKIEVEVRSEVDDVSFIADLEASPIFSEVVLLNKAVDPRKQLTIRVQMLTVAPFSGPSNGAADAGAAGGPPAAVGEAPLTPSPADAPMPADEAAPAAPPTDGDAAPADASPEPPVEPPDTPPPPPPPPAAPEEGS